VYRKNAFKIFLLPSVIHVNGMPEVFDVIMFRAYGIFHFSKMLCLISSFSTNHFYHPNHNRQCPHVISKVARFNMLYYAFGIYPGMGLILLQLPTHQLTILFFSRAWHLPVILLA